MLCSIFLILSIHLGPWSLNEGWHIYQIVEPVILTAVVFPVLASSDRSGIFLIIDIIILNVYRMLYRKTCGKLYKRRNLVNWGSINRLQNPFTLWQVLTILTGVGISSLGTKLFWVWIHKKQNYKNTQNSLYYSFSYRCESHYFIVEKNITWSRNFKIKL